MLLLELVVTLLRLVGLSRLLEWIADTFKFPTIPGLDIERWVKSFLEPTTAYLLIIVIVVWLLFLFLFPKINKIKEPKDVFNLRWYFYVSLILIFFIQLIFTFIIGDRNIGRSVLSYILAWSLITGISGVILFWLLTLVYSPPRLKYTPWGRRWIRRIIEMRR